MKPKKASCLRQQASPFAFEEHICDGRCRYCVLWYKMIGHIRLLKKEVGDHTIQDRMIQNIIDRIFKITAKCSCNNCSPELYEEGGLPEE